MDHQTSYRDSWVEVNLSHISYNVHQLKQRLSNDTNIYAIVKANGYGHGDVEVAKVALEAGAKGLAVALLDEALKLREAGIEAPILVMGWIRPEDAQIAAKYDITVTFFQEEWLEAVKQTEITGKLKLHMKWDTGMGRIGVRTEQELLNILEQLDDNRLELEGIFTHFATADEQDLSYYHKQQAYFDKLLKVFQNNWSRPVILHTGNSAASMRFPAEMRHYVRYGISLYGLYPSPDVKKEKPIDLKPALSLHSRLIHSKKLSAGESISYGATYTTEKDEWIGTVPLGYADGIRRQLQGMRVLVNGESTEIVGRICMDQLMIRLPEAYPVGTKVTLIGQQDSAEISMDEVAEYIDSINYEVACMISSRVPRVYIRGNQSES